ncbi:MAG: hypothetical protein HY722_13745 [Planctomycetes bacterium]|nr:hypothetical protein [Planctomycetota bacterium]
MAEAMGAFFGRIAVKNGLCTEAQVEECLGIQRGAAEHRRIGEIFVERGYLSAEQVEKVLRAQKRSRALLAESLFGQIAVKEGLITSEQLAEALREQKERSLRVPVGTILVEKGYIGETEWRRVLRSQDRARKGETG